MNEKALMTVEDVLVFYKQFDPKQETSSNQEAEVYKHLAIDGHNYNIFIPSGSLASDTLVITRRDYQGTVIKANEEIHCNRLSSQTFAFIYLAYFFGDNNLRNYDKQAYCCEVGQYKIKIEENYIKQNFYKLLKEASKCIPGMKAYIAFRNKK